MAEDKNVKTDNKNFGRCVNYCGFWPIVIVAIVAIFAVGFGLRACSIADEPEEVIEATAYPIPSQGILIPLPE